MKLVWHIVVKDARRMWPAVLVWSLLFTVHHFLTWRVTHTPFDGTEALPRLKFFQLMVFVVQLLSGYVFAATVVLEDSPIGTSTFWLTRPISGARLLLAKIGSCFLWFIVLALLLSLPWWAASERQQRELLLDAAALFRWQACTVGAAVVISAFTGGLGRFLVWSFGAAFAVMVVRLIDPPGILAAESLEWLAVTATAALWVHYQTRRRRLLLALLMIGVISSATIALASIG